MKILYIFFQVLLINEAFKSFCTRFCTKQTGSSVHWVGFQTVTVLQPLICFGRNGSVRIRWNKWQWLRHKNSGRNIFAPRAAFMLQHIQENEIVTLKVLVGFCGWSCWCSITVLCIASRAGDALHITFWQVSSMSALVFWRTHFSFSGSKPWFASFKTHSCCFQMEMVFLNDQDSTLNCSWDAVCAMSDFN